ncbi:coiled-coil domain-containing protein 115 [Mangifera indica]|uniref:coiled-coil domain-containing protein 115 n=1 Tax=Mangifera indica TaxID=29780 RepID=UPI001CFA22C4|nr:coiled-coil domain-containing protein 115 [Mangifera indica]XP_044474881.1 coiled-coil domain-containing protein 115 [Mangifera indica]
MAIMKRVENEDREPSAVENEDHEPNTVENGREKQQEEKQIKDETLLQFLDSTDGYLMLIDSLSSTLRQGWLELASARHSMGSSRVSSALLDLKVHSAATSVQVSQQDADSMFIQHRFLLRKWASSDDGEEKSRGDKLPTESDSQLQHRNNSSHSEKASERNGEKASERNGSPLTLDDQVQKQRSKSLSVFGALVSPRLRAAQISFETALEILVEIANMRSEILASFDQVHEKLGGT